MLQDEFPLKLQIRDVSQKALHIIKTKGQIYMLLIQSPSQPDPKEVSG